MQARLKCALPPPCVNMRRSRDVLHGDAADRAASKQHDHHLPGAAHLPHDVVEPVRVAGGRDDSRGDHLLIVRQAARVGRDLEALTFTPERISKLAT